MRRIILKKGEEGRILQGHPWIFDNEIGAVYSGPHREESGLEALESGETADVESVGKHFLGRAFVNPKSKITARIYGPSKEGVDKGFFKHRLREALERRSSYNLEQESCRIAFAEADFLPALILDRYVGFPLEAAEAAVTERPLTLASCVEKLGKPQSWISAQFLCSAMDQRKEMILDALTELLSPDGIIEKSTARVRELEGLPLFEGLIRGSYPEGGILIFEGGIPFACDISGGQKTGHYLDQSRNRALVSPYARDGRVLDVCCYSGGFGIHALRGGAASLTAVDASSAALEALRRNAALNGLEDRVTTLEGDVFSILPGLERKKEKFDLVILDPPAFAKSGKTLEGALRGYKEINLRALALLKSGGTLVSCSCSQALDEGRFRRLIREAAVDSGKRLYELDFRFQGPDHPILLGYEESRYLKCGIFRVV